MRAVFSARRSGVETPDLARAVRLRIPRNGEEPMPVTTTMRRRVLGTSVRRCWSRKWARAALAMLAGVGALVGSAELAPATEIPSAAYYGSYPAYYEGRFAEAG